MLEKTIERGVCQYARSQHGVLTYKFTSPGQRSVPDRLFITPDGLVVFIEFKAAGKMPTEQQYREMAKLIMRGQIVLVIDDLQAGKELVDAFVNHPKEFIDWFHAEQRKATEGEQRAAALVVPPSISRTRH